MRSEIVHAALSREPNRYALCRLSAKAARMLHRPNTRLQETLNEALHCLARERPRSRSHIVGVHREDKLRAA